eukprot:TCALIF_07023-PA protein Name:"Protein of unknown function" AED:0.00 eAED:0.00 QI:863/1/1/1/1/1/4/147/255
MGYQQVAVVVVAALCSVSAQSPPEIGVLCLGQICSARCILFSQDGGACNPRTKKCECSQVKIESPAGTIVDNAGEVVQNGADSFRNSFQNLVKSFTDGEISQNIQSALSVSCEIDDDDSTCVRECHLRNFKSGTCNADDSRCLCSEDRITAFEYGMCSSLGVCNAYCQGKAYVRGECSGFGGWTCQCIGKDVNGAEVFFEAPELDEAGNPLAVEESSVTEEKDLSPDNQSHSDTEHTQSDAVPQVDEEYEEEDVQ